MDADLAARHPERMSTKQAAATAKRLAHQADPEAAMARARKARTDRRVTLRPAPDTMSLPSGLLPVDQGVACLAALQAETATRRADGDPRSKGQIMADTLVARLTGQATAEDVGVEVGIQLPLGALIDPEDPTAAEIPGWGSLPAGLARELIVNAQGRARSRRLFTQPTRDGGQIVVDLDHRRRRFTDWLAELIRWRDWPCRDPFCDAPTTPSSPPPPPATSTEPTHPNHREIARRPLKAWFPGPGARIPPMGIDRARSIMWSWPWSASPACSGGTCC